MSWFHDAFGPHYPVLYAHRDTAEAMQCTTWLLARLPLRSGPVLDLGCGAGRHLALLRAAGVRAAGLDLSAALLSAARREDPAAPLVRGDMRALPVRSGSLVAVLSLFTAFGYFGDLTDHAAVVAGIARALRRGGWWILDYLDAAAVRAELADGPRTATGDRGPLRWRAVRRLVRDGARVRKETRVVPLPGREAEARALGVPPAGRVFTEEVALFGSDELAALAAPAGLRLVETAGDYDGRPAAPGSPRRIMLLRKEVAT